jgi:putative transposase
MPRIGRVVDQNMPHHIVQRGHNKNAVFVENDDYSYYLNTLIEWTQFRWSSYQEHAGLSPP